MGMFGSAGKAIGNYFSGPVPLSSRLQSAGAALGGDFQASAAIRAAAEREIAQQQQQASVADMVRQLTQLTQPQYSNPQTPQFQGPATATGSMPAIDPSAFGKAPVRTADPAGIADPRVAALAARAGAMKGFDIGPYLEALKAAQPNIQYDRGQGYDSKTGQSAGAYHPDLDKGQIPLYDSGGKFAGVKNADGSVQSAAEMAGAVEAAKARAQAPYQPVQTQDATGRPMTINATQLAAGANGQGAPFVGQSPAQTAADTTRATAGANADIAIPQSQADAQQAVQLIETLKANPALHDRTGWKSLLPALPGTPGAAFDAADDQLRGKLFMQAYSGLKGGGQITEVEGKKATQAIARLSRSQSADDYVRALNDLKGVIQTGLQRAQQQPGRLQPNAATRSSGGTAPPAAAALLRAKPELAAAFDAKYGAGASRAVLGR